MTYLLFVAAAIGLAWAAQRWLGRHSLDDVQAEAVLEQNVAEPDEPFVLRITLRNTGHRPVPFVRAKMYFPRGITPQDPAHTVRDIERRGSTVSYSAWLSPRQETEFRLPLCIAQRGRYVLQHLFVYGGDFLGLTEQVKEIKRFQEIVIAPREAPAQKLRGRLGGMTGNHSANRFLYEDAILTAGCRPYTGQEPMKSILWKQSARGIGLMVKKYDYTTEPKLTVLLNVDLKGDSSEEADAALESLLSLARTTCRVLEEKAVTYELLTNAQYDLVSNMFAAGSQSAREALEVRQGLGAAHFHRVLQNLGRATRDTTMSAEAFLERALGDPESHSRILLTTRQGMPDAAMVARLRTACSGSLQVLTPEDTDG